MNNFKILFQLGISSCPSVDRYVNTHNTNCKLETLIMENFNFTWREFNENSCSTIRNLFEDKQFSDVTILSEDGEEMKLHRAILASSSAFFRNVLTKINQSDPLIFLKGIQSKELHAIVQFMYLGQAEVPNEDLKSFMEAAKCLQVPGLSDNFSTLSASDPQSNSSSSDKPPVTKRVRFSLEKNQNIVFDQTELNENDFVKCAEMEQQVGNRVNQIEKTVTSSEEMQDCQKNRENRDNIKYSCESCDQMYNRQDNLQRHLKIAHGQLLL